MSKLKMKDPMKQKKTKTPMPSMRSIAQNLLEMRRASQRASDDSKINKLISQGIINSNSSYKELKKIALVLMEVEEMIHCKASHWTVSRINKVFKRTEKIKSMQNGSMNMVKAVRDALEKAEKRKKELKEKKEE